MNNNPLPLLLAALCLCAAAQAQPTVGQPLPSAISTAEAQAKTQDAAAKAQALRNAEQDYETAQLVLVQAKLLQIGLPKQATTAQESALQKRAYPGYVVGFSAEHGQPQWSAHLIRRDIFDMCLAREEDFFEDLSLAGAARLSQYRSSGFQRGHMAPAADFRWSPKASTASNILSNIAPQPASMNEGLWADLEISARRYLQVRDSLDELLVVTGPLLEAGLKKLKDTSRVSIPKRFFKVVVNLREQQGFAFLMETTAPDVAEAKVPDELRKRAMSIDSLEKLLRMDFFPNLTAAQNRNIEAKLDIDDWFAIPGESLGRIPPPITDPALLTDAANTLMLTPQNFKDRKAVVGTVTRISVGPSGGFTLFFDDLPPNNRFVVQVQARDADKFKAPPLPAMLGRVLRAEGTISADGERFRMSVRDAKKLAMLR
jgi:endonuclease G, mitochondrial